MLEQSIDFFIPLVQDHRFLAYGALFVAMLIEGEAFLIIAGMLASLRALDFGDVLWVAFVGVLLGDAFWYVFGMFIARMEKLAYIARFAEKSVFYFLPRFREKPFLSIFLSKFIYGVNHAVLVLSGVLRISFPLFMKAEAIASFAWVAIYAVAGYMFGHAAVVFTRKASHFVLLIVVFVVGFILLQKLITSYYERLEHQKLESR
ncbi:MAG: VTT domain-containing protein [Patescibacteria group bacterium]